MRQMSITLSLALLATALMSRSPAADDPAVTKKYLGVETGTVVKVESGSITLNGISLTVNRVDATGFSVSLIPHTQTATTLAQKGTGGLVNLEVDLIGKYVEKLVGGYVK